MNLSQFFGFGAFVYHSLCMECIASKVQEKRTDCYLQLLFANATTATVGAVRFVVPRTIGARENIATCADISRACFFACPVCVAKRGRIVATIKSIRPLVLRSCVSTILGIMVAFVPARRDTIVGIGFAIITNTRERMTPVDATVLGGFERAIVAEEVVVITPLCSKLGFDARTCVAGKTRTVACIFAASRTGDGVKLVGRAIEQTVRGLAVGTSVCTGSAYVARSLVTAVGTSHWGRPVVVALGCFDTGQGVRTIASFGTGGAFVAQTGSSATVGA